MRVLDIDLDFFLYRTAHYCDSDSGRLSADECPPWPVDKALTFLSEQCGLREKLPGFVAEYHDEIFYHWGEAIESGQMAAPLEVVHVDAHADLGLGDSGFMYLMGRWGNLFWLVLRLASTSLYTRAPRVLHIFGHLIG